MGKEKPRTYRTGPRYSPPSTGKFFPNPSNDLFLLLVPTHGSALPVRINGHSAGDGGAEAQFEGAVGFFAAAHAVEEILHVQGGGIAHADDVRSLAGRLTHARGLRLAFLGNVAHVVVFVAENRSFVAE